MTYTVFFERITDKSFPEGFYYAHIPTLDLTTHGLDVEGAREAAKDLLRLWLKEKKANGEEIKVESDSFYSKLKIEAALFSESRTAGKILKQAKLSLEEFNEL